MYQHATPLSSQDRDFIALQGAYRPHGGISRLHQLAAAGWVGPAGHEVAVEALVAAGLLFSFPWHHDLWIPLFQFEQPGHTVAPAPRRVVAELDRGFDGWALASWFVQPNAWLDQLRPIDCLSSRLPDVLEAARADRFVATG